MSDRVDQVPVSGGAFDLPVWLPEGGSGPGLVLIQEIFGLDDYLRSVAADLAALGYVVAVPELFWRIEPNWVSTHDEAGVAASMAVVSRFDAELGASDVLAALAHLRSLPEVTGGAGVFGFCLGGALAFAAAAAADPDVAVSFYGSSVPDQVGLLDQVSCPILFHFGGQDPYIPREAVQRVVDAVQGHEGAEIHVQEQAGHAFHNHSAPMFHHPEAAAEAWRLTTEFLARTLPA
ncbi:dienelactone hydrolase family protein [Amycolatopsis nigrescens]|uniref:dienelactone hydrolase family protein n=1 Tax=Amycolatopsis nigrescens TaxID=381445 RepID=UPI00036B356E|nr:dienelactone hydrolase family protein [Amycolatopsis nigrescens]